MTEIQFGEGPRVPLKKLRTSFRSIYPLKESLEFYLLATWIHGFFWGMSNSDRAFMLSQVYGLGPWSAQEVESAVNRLGLKGWSDFPAAYPKPPLSVQLFPSEINPS